MGGIFWTERLTLILICVGDKKCLRLLSVPERPASLTRELTVFPTWRFNDMSAGEAWEAIHRWNEERKEGG